MIRNNTKKRMWSIIPIMLIAGGVFFASCNDNIVVGSVDETPYILSGESFGYLKDVTTSRTEIPVKVTNSIDLKVSFGLSKATGETVSATLAADTTLVQTYNETNNKAYKAFPADQVTIAGNGVLSVGQWKTASNPLTVSLAKGALSNGTYLLPITVKESATVKITESLKTLYYVIEVADVFTPGSTAKPGGVKTLCYVEVGNANANMLNVGAYVLKDSGIPFFDIAVVFAANIKYDVATGEVSLVYNESVGHILRNRDTYIKPLQDKGIKVILGVVGNWDFAGVANLQGDVLRNYAKQCQIAIDTYGLDGIDFDDEWSTYSPNTSATAYAEFLASSWYPTWAPNGTKMARLIIEMRRLLGPDKIITVFEYGYAQQLPAVVDGVTMTDIIDYSMYPMYSNAATMRTSYINMPRLKYSPTAVNMTAGNGVTQMQPNILSTVATNVKNGGYGFIFFYDLRDDDKTDYLSAASVQLYGDSVKIVEPLRPHW